MLNMNINNCGFLVWLSCLPTTPLQSSLADCLLTSVGTCLEMFLWDLTELEARQRVQSLQSIWCGKDTTGDLLAVVPVTWSLQPF